MIDIIAHELQCCGHVLVESAQRHTCLVIADTHAVVASQLIESFLDVVGRTGIGADIVEIVSRNLQLLAVLTAHREDEREVEEVVSSVLLVEHLGAVLHLTLAQILVEVDELWLDRLRLAVDNGGEEVTMLVVVRRNRRDVRLLNLVDRRVVAETLVDTDIVVKEVTAGEVHDLLFGDLRHTVELPHDMLPALAIDEGILHHLGAVAVTAQAAQHIKFLVGKDSLHQVLVKLSTFEFLYLGKHEVTHLFELLSLLGLSLSDERGVVGQAFHARTGTHHFHRLVEVDIHESGLAVGKEIRDEAQRVGLVRSGLVKLPAEYHVLGFLSNNSGVDVLLQVCDRRILGS